jgi:hypothetical protein
MTRLLTLLPILVTTSCSVGEYGVMNNNNMMDGAGGGDDRDKCVDKLAVPDPPHQHAAAGANPAGPRSGLGCLAAGGCHGAQPGSVAFTVAGTVYKEMGGTTVVGGLTVRLYNAGSKKSLAKTVTDMAGNFFITTPVTFPAGGIEADVTGCGSSPDIIPMIAPIRQNEANCASSTACHVVPGPRAIYLP